MKPFDQKDLHAVRSLVDSASIEMREDEAIGMAQNLNYVKSRVYKETPRTLEGVDIIPIDSEVPEWAETVSYRIYDQVGIAKIIANYADDLPRADVLAEEKSVRVKDVGDSYGYNLAEIRASNATGENLPSQKALSARWAVEVRLAKIAMQGDSDYGLYGLLNHPNIGIANPTYGNWQDATRTAQEIVSDVRDMVDNIEEQSNEIHSANTLLLPKRSLAAMKNTYVNQTAITAYELVTKEFPNLRIRGYSFLNGTPGSQEAFVGQFDVGNIGHIVPLRFMQLPAQARNLELVVPCLARTGGVALYRPLAFAKAVNL